MAALECDNCGRIIKLDETPFVYNEHPVCEACCKELTHTTKPKSVRDRIFTVLMWFLLVVIFVFEPVLGLIILGIYLMVKLNKFLNHANRRLQ